LEGNDPVEVRAEAAHCDRPGGSIRIGWELPGSALGYVLISLPTEEGDADDAFFGHSHYVEVRDQANGRYGGLEHLAVLDDHKVLLRLSQPVPGVGAELVVRTRAPLNHDVLAQLRRAEILVRGAGA
jgi:hypothetical protein